MIPGVTSQVVSITRKPRASGDDPEVAAMCSLLGL